MGRASTCGYTSGMDTLATSFPGLLAGTGPDLASPPAPDPDPDPEPEPALDPADAGALLDDDAAPLPDPDPPPEPAPVERASASATLSPGTDAPSPERFSIPSPLSAPAEPDSPLPASASLPSTEDGLIHFLSSFLLGLAACSWRAPPSETGVAAEAPATRGPSDARRCSARVALADADADEAARERAMASGG